MVFFTLWLSAFCITVFGNCAVDNSLPVFAKLLAQHAARHFFNFAALQLAQLKRPKAEANKPIYLKVERFQYFFNLAVFAPRKAMVSQTLPPCTRSSDASIER